MTKKRVIFLYRKGLSGSGSKIMRCDQLRDICEAHLGDSYDFEVRAQRPIRNPIGMDRACSALRDSIVILLKGTAGQFGQEGMQLLRRKARGVCIDYVDADVYASFSKQADVHIGASHAACGLLETVLTEAGVKRNTTHVMHLTHHADPRLEGAMCRPGRKLNAAYLGNPANVHLPEAVRRKVELISYERDADIAEVFDILRNFNMHYCVRPNLPMGARKRVAKPFTKGFTAAVMGAQIMTTRDTDDALHYLGPEYPFLLDDNSEDGILEALERAEWMFGTPAWAEAEDRLAHVREMSSPRRIAGEMNDILQIFN